jgi:hypothetical protein
MPIWRVSRSDTSSAAVRVQITSAAYTVSSERGGIGDGGGGPAASAILANLEICTEFWPPVRMNSG